MNSFFFQIILAGLAIAIVFLYLKPTFADIGDIQDAISQYKVEQQKVNEVNIKLAALVTKANNISSEDQTRLLTYMPDKVDTISVSRDIFNISVIAGVDLGNITYKETKDSDQIISDKPKIEDLESTEPVSHDFSVTISGEYNKIKDFLLLIEQSNYPLEVHDLEVTKSDEEILTIKMEIVTYSHI